MRSEKHKTANKADILFFVEDPGPANYVASLPYLLEKKGLHSIVMSAGLAKEYLFRRNVTLHEFPSSVTVDEIMESVRPRVLVVGTSENKNTMGLELIDAASAHGITTVGVIDASMNAEFRFRGHGATPLAHAPDWLLVPDELTKEVFVATEFPESHIVVCGHPNYDYVLGVAAKLAAQGVKNLRKYILPDAKDKKVVVFVSEGSARLKLLSPKLSIEEYTFRGRGAGTGRTEIVIEEFLDALRLVSPRPYVVLRPHPKDVEADYSIYLDEFDYFDNTSMPLELVYSSDLVVGTTSMLIMEAALMGIPTLSLVPREVEKTWLASIRAGITRCVTTRTDLISTLKDMLEYVSADHQSKNTSFIAAGSSHKVVAFIESLL